MATWETEDESTGPAPSLPALPTPADTPYGPLSRTVSRGSRKSGRSITPPGKKGKSRSPPPISGGDKIERASKRSSRDVTNDENISILDPRRFTPTLHASLVSEILSLRRDQEEKLKIIESLETSLHTVREESESLQASLVSTGKESRSLKRQLSLLEGGTTSAIGELAKERDDAVESAADARKRLDAAQKKIRSQEEDSARVHEEWARDKDEWEEEKRKYERRVHVAETRLKAVLDEVAAFQAAQAASMLNGAAHGHESDGEESVKENDAASVRSMSLTNSIRFSVANSILKANGNSLADELGFDGYDEDSDYGGRDSVLSKHHSRNFSRDSIPFRSHQRHQSTDSLMRPGSVLRGKLTYNAAALERLEDGIIREDDESAPPAPAPTFNYVDTGVQFSPPPSPKLAPVKPATPEPRPLSQSFERFYGVESPPRVDHEIEANQRRKRVHVAQPLGLRAPGVQKLMVNGSSQTVEEPLSPPRTPKTPLQGTPASPEPKAPAMVSASTQTDDIPPPLPPSFLEPPLTIPSISIIPPSSRPSTPREPRLPQLCKDFGCQVSLPSNVSMTSSSMQTEEIRVDMRLARLPPHLHPSAITSRPSSPAIGAAEIGLEETRQFTPIPGNVPPRNPRRLATKRSLTDMPSSPISPSILEEGTRDLYPGDNDDGPLSSHRAPMRRPPRISSLFAGFDGNSTDEADEFMDADFSDSEYRTALSAPRPLAGPNRGGKRNSVGTATSSENAFSPKASSRLVSPGSEDGDAFDSAFYPVRDGLQGRRGSRRGGRPSAFGTKSSVMRRTAMIHSGIASHQRARSPSLTDHKEPPFPIPTRASSRIPPMSTSAPSDGGTSPSRALDAWPRRGSNRSHYRANSIRKVRSAAVLPRNPKIRRRGSRSPPPFSPSSGTLESPGFPPLPHNDITAPRTRDGSVAPRYKGHRSHPSTTTANTTETGAGSQGGGSSQPPTVVDTIAQTMVGEWMYKYVRRRKSFGVADNKGGDDSSNDRHKRWVWLAPYERAILWSSKQPASGSALLGKSGRKLTIQSVLDVKDNNPPPKGATQIFNRSILILTPQRALKFTAANAERHYIWLTSLSFLAHSNQAIPDTLTVPPAKPLVEQYEIPPKPKRRAIRDSIRLTKARAAVIKSDPVMEEVAEMDSAPPSIPTSRPPPVPEIYTLPAHARDMSRDAAEPPSIPRFADRTNHGPVHGRKRSNTGGHVPPPLSFRGFSGPAGSSGYHTASNSTAGNSVMTAGSSDIYSNGGASAATGSSGVTWATPSMRSSEASSRPSGPVGNNFFDAIGTVRMEAFISPLQFHETPYGQQDEFRQMQLQGPRRRSKELRRRASRSSRQRDSYHSRGTRTTDETEDWFMRDDPFRGF